jgi:phosphatidylglycerol:prolipoprotein diacylglycerol transferase
MLPVLFTLTIPAGLAAPLVVALLLAVALGRAWAFRRRAAKASADAAGRGGGRRAAAVPKRPSWGAALWDDRLTLLVLAVAAAVAWRSGALDGPIRLPLHAYGLMIAAGFLVGIALAQREARRVGQDPERIGDLSFLILVAALVGSRLYFVAVNASDYFGANAWLTVGGVRLPRLLALWEGGLVFYGGFLAAAAATAWYVRRHRMAFLPYADTLIPSLALGHFFGRLGCFAAGCCWGSTSHAHLPWLTRFPPESLAYQAFAARPDAGALLAPDRLTTVPIHPTQLYEAFGELGLFLALALLVRPRKRFPGQVLATWLLAYAVLRSVVELFRGDVERGVVAGLAVGQWTSVAIFAAGVAVWALARRAAPAAGAPAVSA